MRGSPSYLIGTGTSDENGFSSVMNIFESNPTLKAGDWKIQLKTLSKLQ